MKVSIRRFWTLFCALGLLAALVVPLAPAAQATHGINELEVLPDAQVVPFGTDTTTLTATIGAPAQLPVNVDFENQSDVDGNTTMSPDFTCTILATQTECTITIEREGGPDLWRVWIDADGINGTFDGDPDEGRIASTTTDCEHDSTDTCSPSPNDPLVPGVGCGALPSPAESDCTDVVRVTWAAQDAEITSVDCDDSSGPNTEQETNAPGDDETYTCRVLDQFGAPMLVDVYGEVEGTGNVPNDPDPSDGSSYEEPDYFCAMTPQGSCTVDVGDVENELGTSEICWWVEDDDVDETTVDFNRGETHCGDEPTLEETNADGSDDGNDLADQTQLTYDDPANYRLECLPETDSNPAGSAHTVTCTVTSPTTNQGVADVNVDVEATGANDPDLAPLPGTPDFTCDTGANGQCSFTHGPGGTGATTAEGTTTYRAWVDADGLDATTEADASEGRDEAATPGATPESDDTDVVEKIWTPAPANIVFTPESDSAEVGECNPYQITVTDDEDNPLSGIIVDVEQVHEAAGGPANSQPIVGFCSPNSGPNPTTVNTAEGDLGPSSAEEDREQPDRNGTAGGETFAATNAQGQVTIGISVNPSGGSDGSGLVELTGFWDPNDNDDPDTGEAQATATKQWAEQAEAGGRAIDCEPETATTPTNETHEVTCLVTDDAGEPAAGVDVTFTEQGPGSFATPSQQTTDNSGEVSATVESTEGGDQTITGTITNSTQDEPDTDDCDRPANDPAGAPAGQCSDSVTNTWEQVDQPECSDGQDNDGDGLVDDEDPDCDSPDDDSEAGDTCPGYESVDGNHVVGTDGDDVLVGTDDRDIICGLGGDDLLDGLGSSDILVGGSGNDAIAGGGGADDILGQGGNDEIEGNGGNDEVSGGPGSDVMKGGAGNDSLRGNGGKDVIRGGSGRDTIKGGGGNDRLFGNGGPDNINGNSGTDRCKGGKGNDKVRKCEKGQTKNG